MRKNIEITPKDFSGLLEYLSPDADEAAKKYEEIRARLIKYFYFRGCFDPEALADEAINRITVRLPETRFTDTAAFAGYFYSFASNIYLEDLRRRKKVVSIEEITSETNDHAEETGHSSVSACLERCLLTHPPKERNLVMEYYSFGKGESSRQRKRMAVEQDMSEQSLYAFVARVRKSLRECVKNCLNERGS
jgi:DNA-directed RNA polymerase specialized sigma24 family protein